MLKDDLDRMRQLLASIENTISSDTKNKEDPFETLSERDAAYIVNELKGYQGYHGNLFWCGTWDKNMQYKWDPRLNVPLVIYKQKLWVAKYIPKQGVPPDEDKKGWLLWPGGGGGSGVIEIHGDAEIIANPTTGIVQLKIGNTILRTKQFNDEIEKIYSILENKEDKVKPPDEDNMLMVYNHDGSRFWSKHINKKNTFRNAYKPEDIVEGILTVTHNLNETTYLQYTVYGIGNMEIYPDILEYDENTCAMDFTNLLPLYGEIKVLIIKY